MVFLDIRSYLVNVILPNIKRLKLLSQKDIRKSVRILKHIKKVPKIYRYKKVDGIKEN